MSKVKKIFSKIFDAVYIWLTLIIALPFFAEGIQSKGVAMLLRNIDGFYLLPFGVVIVVVFSLLDGFIAKKLNVQDMQTTEPKKALKVIGSFFVKLLLTALVLCLAFFTVFITDALPHMGYRESNMCAGYIVIIASLIIQRIIKERNSFIFEVARLCGNIGRKLSKSKVDTVEEDSAAAAAAAAEPTVVKPIAAKKPSKLKAAVGSFFETVGFILSKAFDTAYLTFVFYTIQPYFEADFIKKLSITPLAVISAVIVIAFSVLSKYLDDKHIILEPDTSDKDFFDWLVRLFQCFIGLLFGVGIFQTVNQLEGSSISNRACIKLLVLAALFIQLALRGTHSVLGRIPGALIDISVEMEIAFYNTSDRFGKFIAKAIFETIILAFSITVVSVVLCQIFPKTEGTEYSFAALYNTLYPLEKLSAEGFWGTICGIDWGHAMFMVIMSVPFGCVLSGIICYKVDFEIGVISDFTNGLRQKMGELVDSITPDYRTIKTYENGIARYEKVDVSGHSDLQAVEVLIVWPLLLLINMLSGLLMPLFIIINLIIGLFELKYYLKDEEETEN